MYIPSYLKQTEKKNKKEATQEAVVYFHQLLKKHYSLEKARKKVVSDTGVVL